jgi:hypothetical protein
LLGNVIRLYDNKLTKVSDGCQNVDLNRMATVIHMILGIK